MENKFTRQLIFISLPFPDYFKRNLLWITPVNSATILDQGFPDRSSQIMEHHRMPAWKTAGVRAAFQPDPPRPEHRERQLGRAGQPALDRTARRMRPTRSRGQGPDKVCQSRPQPRCSRGRPEALQELLGA